MPIVTIEELDSMPDDDFYVFVDRARAVVLEASDAQRQEMVSSHEAWVETLEGDLREGIDWSTETRSEWDLYAELRMNGIEFGRVPRSELAL